jgi:hypothetical protein
LRLGRERRIEHQTHALFGGLLVVLDDLRDFGERRVLHIGVRRVLDLYQHQLVGHRTYATRWIRAVALALFLAFPALIFGLFCGLVFKASALFLQIAERACDGLQHVAALTLNPERMLHQTRAAAPGFVADLSSDAVLEDISVPTN